MLDVIITSTCRKTIVRALKSFFKNVSCSEKFNFIVNIDVLNPGYLSSLLLYLKKCKITDISINNRPKDYIENHTRALCCLFKRIETPHFFHLEDDWIFFKKINLDSLICLMQRHSYIDQIRFSKEKIKEKAWLYYLSDEIKEEYLLPNIQVEIDGIPLVQTPAWSFNPSIARTSAIKNFTDMPSSAMGPEIYICKAYPKIFNHQGTYIYGRIADGPAVKDIGRNNFRQLLRKLKYTLSGKKYAEYKF